VRGFRGGTGTPLAFESIAPNLSRGTWIVSHPSSKSTRSAQEIAFADLRQEKDADTQRKDLHTRQQNQARVGKFSAFTIYPYQLTVQCQKALRHRTCGQVQVRPLCRVQ
jgi:hypothetical protein